MKNLAVSPNRLLPWEDVDEYETLHAGMLEAYDPQGPMECHLVNELSGCIWRTKRTSIAESALHHKGMHEVIDRTYSKASEHALAYLGPSNSDSSMTTALVATNEDTAAKLVSAQGDRAMTEKARSILNSGRPKAYEKALAALRGDTAVWWLDMTNPEEYDEEDEVPYDRNADGLQAFLTEEVLPDYDKTERELQNRPAIKVQICAETLNPEKHQALAVYETHLDRKLERTLALLMKVQNTRRQAEKVNLG